MWTLTKSKLRPWAERLLHIRDTPERTAMAFAVGVFVGFSPLLGLHTALGILLAFALNLNRVAVILGVYMNLPWFIAPFYAAGTALGALITGARVPSDFMPHLDRIWQTPGWVARFDALGQLLRPLLPSYLIGSTILAVALGVAAYFACLTFLRARHAFHNRHPEVR